VTFWFQIVTLFFIIMILYLVTVTLFIVIVTMYQNVTVYLTFISSILFKYVLFNLYASIHPNREYFYISASSRLSLSSMCVSHAQQAIMFNLSLLKYHNGWESLDINT